MKDNHFSIKSYHESENHLVKVSRNYYRHLSPTLRETTVIMTYEKPLVYDKLALFANSYHLVKTMQYTLSSHYDIINMMKKTIA